MFPDFSEQNDPSLKQGEKFNTLNRLHSKINSALAKQGQFLKVRSLDLEGGRFPVHFMLNKNFSVRLK